MGSSRNLPPVGNSELLTGKDDCMMSPIWERIGGRQAILSWKEVLLDHYCGSFVLLVLSLKIFINISITRNLFNRTTKMLNSGTRLLKSHPTAVFVCLFVL